MNIATPRRIKTVAHCTGYGHTHQKGFVGKTLAGCTAALYNKLTL